MRCALARTHLLAAAHPLVCCYAQATPAMIVRFLGIILDSGRMEARLDPERLTAIQESLKEWSSKTHCTERELQSLIGVLSFASKVVPAGRTFLRRMIVTLSAPRASHRYARSPTAAQPRRTHTHRSL